MALSPFLLLKIDKVLFQEVQKREPCPAFYTFPVQISAPFVDFKGASENFLQDPGQTSTNQNADGKESVCSAENPGSMPGSGRSPGEGNGNPLQYPCLENSMDEGAWRAMVPGGAKSWTPLSD